MDRTLDLPQFERVVRSGEQVQLSGAARRRLARSREVVDAIASGQEAVYGINTGFGKFATTKVPPEQVCELQRRLLLSHAVGVGPELPAEVVRGMLLLRAQSLALGYSGVRPLLVDYLLALLNAEAYPLVPSQGSLGASGDLAPLAHLSLPLLGLGQVERFGQRMSGDLALRSLDLVPLELQAKEGLALINGTQLMGSLLALAALDARRLLALANLGAAMTVEALRGSHRPFRAEVVLLRPHPGARQVAAALRSYLQDSEIEPSHRDCGRVQDAYSLRAAPQVHGAVADALTWTEQTLEVELVSVTDNPLVFPESAEVISGGNFHGQPLALAADQLAIALTSLTSICERRIEQLLNPALSGLPAFLTPQGGLNSGLMIAQYTAAALVGENRVLAHPASTDSIPTSAGQEDHVPMGAHAARKLRQVVENAYLVVAAEWLCAAQALEFQPLRPGRGVERARRWLRAFLPPLAEDRLYGPELVALRDRMRAPEVEGLLYTAPDGNRSL
jgi:histidine ammonia-lyase